jgi:hypothetical protein
MTSFAARIVPVQLPRSVSASPRWGWLLTDRWTPLHGPERGLSSFLSFQWRIGRVVVL